MVEKHVSTDELPLVSPDEIVRKALEKECASNQFGTTVAYLSAQTCGLPPAVVKRILEQAPWARVVLGRYHYVKVPTIASAKETDTPVPAPQQHIQTIDFQHIDDLKFTKPTKLSYFDEFLAIKASWTDTYVKLVSVLYDDYPEIIPQGQSFFGTGRPDFGDSKVAASMIAPKQIGHAGLFLETNLSATDISKKIKALLDICNVDYENVLIEYEHTTPDTTVTQEAPISEKPMPDISAEADVRGKAPTEGMFYRFLRDQANLAERTCRAYVSAIRVSEQFARKHNYATVKLFDCNHTETIATAQALLCDPEFVEINRAQHNALSAAINNLLSCISGTASKTVIKQSPPPVATDQKATEDFSPYQKVLEQNFKRGFRLGSALDIKKFRRYFEESYGELSDSTDSALETKLKACGIVHDGKVFLPQIMLGNGTKEKLLQYINRTFMEGKSAIFHEALFSKFSEDFLDSMIYDADVLREYLRYVLDSNYQVGSYQVTKIGGKRVSTLEEVRDRLKECSVPISIDELCEMLAHIPRETIKALLGANLEFVRNSRERSEYFHADSLDLSPKELELISELISDNIHSRRYISGTELMRAIPAKFSSMYESFSMYSDIGWRDALKYKLGDRFSFNGNIISAQNDPLSMADVFGALAGSCDQLTIDELVQFSEELGSGVIYFEPVYENALRVSEGLFVSKSRAAFHVVETDAVLDRFCTGSYIPLSNIQDFAAFPDADFPWTEYLLESYLASYSDRYMLLHRGYGRSCAIGAIVKKSAGFQSFDALVVDILATSGVALNKESAIDWLFQQRYIASHSYKSIEQLLIQAQALRGRKG